MATIYRHKRESDNKIFYIGYTKFNYNSDEKSGRPWNTRHRTKQWKNIVKMHGLIVEVLISGITTKDALQIEEGLIEYYGRIDLKTGTLINFTNGGELNNGWKPTKEQQQKMLLALKNYWTEDKRKSWGEQMKGKYNMSEAHKQIVSKTHKGKIVSDATKKLLAKPRIPKTEEQKLHHSMKMRESHQRKKL
jgi:hypothetical protein